MLSSSFSVTLALSAITFLSQVSHSVAGVARTHGHLMGQHKARMPSLGSGNRLHIEHRRGSSAPVDVSLADLQLLQSEYTSFHDWMTAWFSLPSPDDQTPSVAQLKLEIQAYDEWISAWLATTMHPDPADKAQSLPSMSSVPLPSPSSSSSNAAPSAPASSVVAQDKHHHSHSVSGPVSTLPAKASSSIYIPPASTYSPQETQASSPPSSPATSTPAIPPKESSAPVYSPLPSSASPPTIPSASAQPTSPGSGSGSSSGGSFSAGSNSNLAVYWGQTPATASVPLSKLCADPSVDIVVLAFLTTFFGPGGYPSVNFGSACGSGPNPAMNAKGATGLLACPDMSSQIASCQSAGKKVLLSLGGAESTTAFTSDDQATQLASRLWDLFGGGTGEKDLRPFGAVALDGFDIDNENHDQSHYTAFTSALRKLSDSAASGGGKKYYISAAPQCPRPDASIPLDAMRQMDFVFVQFYNNGDCDVGAPGFLDSLKAWSADLAGAGAGPKLYIGAPACPSCAGQGYLESEALSAQIASAKGAGLANLGGVMLWDGSEAMQNTGFLGAVKDALA